MTKKKFSSMLIWMNKFNFLKNWQRKKKKKAFGIWLSGTSSFNIVSNSNLEDCLTFIL